MSEADQTQQERLKAAIQMAAKGREAVEQETRSRAGPSHPIPVMQGPFEESIQDATNPPDTRAQDQFNKLNPKQRRQRLLDTASTNGTYNEQWRSQVSRSKFHPLTKIISQVAFGVHLLHQQLAKSDEEVVKILQKHVDDVDNFVQRGEEDMDLAISDIRERITYLKLPLEHANVFDVMLDDKTFRTSILEGNEKIETVVSRTAGFVKDLQVDVQKAIESTIAMGKYLDDVAVDWPEDDRGSVEIYSTMQANVEGWVQCMGTLQMKGNGLSVAVVQLGSILTEMAKRAGSASRREQVRTTIPTFM
jgi:NAD(P)-dependent dehydrogenase (short-subunit alcohol dehydrogenase family)